MKTIIDRLNAGLYHFQSGTKNSPEFNKFFLDFKRVMKKELELVGATDLIMNKGHFYFSGFFKAKSGQLYYFSIGDVRWWDNRKLLYRTAQHTKDWSGGQNCYLTIDKGMWLNVKL